MKIEYKHEGGDSFTMTISSLSGVELDAIRILLITAAQYGNRIDVEQLSLQYLIESDLFEVTKDGD
jgi:hypothetical protein